MSRRPYAHHSIGAGNPLTILRRKREWQVPRPWAVAHSIDEAAELVGVVPISDARHNQLAEAIDANLNSETPIRVYGRDRDLFWFFTEHRP